jgi:hypothetical protein
MKSRDDIERTLNQQEKKANEKRESARTVREVYNRDKGRRRSRDRRSRSGERDRPRRSRSGDRARRSPPRR